MKKGKKVLAYLLAFVLFAGGLYTDSLRVSAENGEAGGTQVSVREIWAKFEGEEQSEFEFADDSVDLKDKKPYAKLIQGNSVENSIGLTDEEIPLFIDNAAVTVANRPLGKVFDTRLSGNSVLTGAGYQIFADTNDSGSQRFSSLDDKLDVRGVVDFYNSKTYLGEGNNPAVPYSYTISGEPISGGQVKWNFWAQAYNLTVGKGAKLSIESGYDESKKRNTSSALEVQNSAQIDGTVIVKKHVPESEGCNRFVVLEGGELKLSKGAALVGEENAELQIAPGVTVEGITLYDVDGKTAFTDFSQVETFHWESENNGGRWVRIRNRNPEGGEDGPEDGLKNNQYQVFFDYSGGSAVKEGESSLNDSEIYTFGSNQELSFQLTQPDFRHDKTPIVEIRVFNNDVEVVYRSDAKDQDHKITIENGGFKFTPASDAPFNINVWWSAYDMFGRTEDKPIIVEMEIEGKFEAEGLQYKVNETAVPQEDQFVDGNKTKIRVPQGTSTIEIVWDKTAPTQIKVENGKTYTETELSGSSKKIELSLKENEDFRNVRIVFPTDTEGGNPSEQPNPNPPQIPGGRKAQIGQVVVNVANTTGDKVGIHYSLGEETGFKEHGPNDMPLVLNKENNQLQKGMKVTLKLVTPGGTAVDTDGDKNVFVVSDGSSEKATRIDVGEIQRGEFSFIYDDSKAYTVYLATKERPAEKPFEGTAYLYWQGKNGAVCHAVLAGLKTNKEDGSYDVNYIEASTIIDERTNEVFSIHSKFEFVKKSMLNDTRLSQLFSDTLTQDDLHALTMDPTNNATGKASVTWTPDRAFRVTFYEEGYEAIHLGREQMKYPEAPFNEKIFAIPDLDIAGTTPETPAILTVYGLEEKVRLITSDNSRTIKEVSPLNVPTGAIEVAEVNGTEGAFDLTFHSNFYDKVVFELVDTDNVKYYVMLVRTTLQATDNMGPGQSKPQVIANFFFPAENGAADYQMIATVWKNDATQEVRVLKPGIVLDQDGGSTGKYEIGIGSDSNPTMKQSSYYVDVDQSVVGISFNILKSGELKGDSFNGAISGSGNGTYFDMEKRRLVYTNVKEGQNE